MRRIVFVGNCQAHMLSQVYQRFAASYIGDQVRYVPSYEDLSDEDRSALATADILVQQILDFEPKVDLTVTKAGVHHHLVPFVTAAFLWPFATEAHIRNQPLAFLRDGPYPPQLGDAYLNRKIAANVDPETAVAEYLDQDLAQIAHLERRYELTMEKQRQRDNVADYNFADAIDRWFRSESVFLSPAHPDLRITLELATQFFTAMDAGSEAILRLEREMLVTPFPKDEAPIHPSVCRHFGLKFIVDPDAQKYRFRCEGSFTFREFALRYMEYEWNRDLDEGIALSMNGQHAEAVEKIVGALSRSPRSGDGHLHLSESLARIGRLEDAVTAAHRAAEPDPACVPASWNLLSHLFSQQGKDGNAISAARQAVALDPSNVHHSAHLGELLKRSDDLAGAVNAFELASSLSPPNAHAIEQFGELRSVQGFLEDGIAALRRAVAIEPANSHFGAQLGKLLKQAGDLDGAEQAFERASQLAPPNVFALAQLGELRAAKGAVEEGVAALRLAIELEPGNAGLHNSLSHLLRRQGDLQAAITTSRKAVSLNAQNSYYCGHLGNMLAENGDVESALEALRQATQVPPTNAQAHVQLARLLGRTQRDEHTLGEALAAADRALELEPGNLDFQELVNSLRNRRRSLEANIMEPSTISVGNTRVHLPKKLASSYVEEVHRLRQMGRSQEAEAVLREAEKHFPEALAIPRTDAIRPNSRGAFRENGELSEAARQTVADPLDFELAPHTGPALRFINAEGRVGAAIQVRYEQSSGQGSFQYWIYDQKDGSRYEPFRVNGDEHPPEEPNSRFNRHVRFLHGFYTPGVVEPERGSMEFHCDPGQPVLQITSHKTDQPLITLHQYDAPEDGFPIVVLHNPSGVAFALRRNGDMTLKGTFWAGGAVVVDAAVTEPKHAATKAYVDNAVDALRDEIGRLREELMRLRSGSAEDR